MSSCWYLDTEFVTDQSKIVDSVRSSDTSPISRIRWIVAVGHMRAHTVGKQETEDEKMGNCNSRTRSVRRLV